MVNLIKSVVEGIESLGEGIGHLVKGEFDEFGKDMARFGMEAAGAVGQVFVGPLADQLQEMLEGSVDDLLSGGGSGDVPPPESGMGPASGGIEIDTLWGTSGPVGDGAKSIVTSLAEYGLPGAGGGLESLLDSSGVTEAPIRETAEGLSKVGAAFREVESMESASHGVYTRQMTSI